MLGIIIPTLNRSDYVVRQLYYYASVNCPYTIYLGDSSNAHHLEAVLSAIERLKNRIKIVHTVIAPGIAAHAVCKELADVVQEKYIAYIGDDDFLVPNSIGKCIEFLEANPEYVSAQGKGAIFSLYGRAYGEIKGMGPYHLKGCEIEIPNQRLSNFLNSYWVLEFSVNRTEYYRQMCDCRDTQSAGFISNGAITEILIGCLSLIRGKSKSLNCLYLLRQGGDHRNTPIHQSFIDQIIHPDWTPSLQIFRDKVIEALVQKEDITKEAASEIVKHAISSYFLNALNKKQQGQNSFKKEIIVFLQKIKKIPGAKALYNQVRRKIPVFQNDISLVKLLSPASPYNDEFLPLFRTITSSEKVLESELGLG